MMCSEAIARVNNQLGYRSDKLDEILGDLQDAQQTLERGVPSPVKNASGTFIPWFLISEVAQVTTTVGEERLSLPSDFVGSVQDFHLYSFNADADDPADEWLQLEKGEEVFIRGKYPGTAEVPKGYFYSGAYWRILPVPSAEATLKCIYGARDTTLTRSPDITNKWLTNAPWVLIASAGISMAQKLRDPGALTAFQQRLAAEVLILYNDTVARFDSNDRPVMGGYN